MENKVFNRLQFVRGLNRDEQGQIINNGVFSTREDAINYVIGKEMVERPSLVGEPIILLYNNVESSGKPHVILAIGSVGDGITQSQKNSTFFIDTQKTEEEIIELEDKLEEAIKSLSLIPLESQTMKLSSEKTDDGTILSGDVKIADYRIVSGKVNENIIQTEGNKGLFAFVDMNYDPETFVITFNVNGVTKDFQLPKDQHVKAGWYDPTEESIFIKLADGSQVRILVTKLIEEWTVLGDASATPVVLEKEHVTTEEEHEGIFDWQDVLKADVRVADHISDNILHKDRTGKYLYVKGTADNIIYKEGQTVKDALDNVDTKISSNSGNLIYKRPDGIYASAMLDYNTAENKLIYTYTDGESGEFKNVEFKLNSVKILEDITYDPVREVIVIRYIDAQGEYQRVEIPAKDIIEEWEVNNEAHNVELTKYRSEGSGKDILTADVKIHNGDNNILEDKNHTLYVNGISDNIKYDVTGDTTVKDKLDSIALEAEMIEGKLNQEISARTSDVQRIDKTIGSGFTTDVHENVTYKFNELSDNLNDEIERATEKENEIASNLADEIANRIEDVNAEEARAKTAEQILDSKIASEQERAVEAENALEEMIEAETTRALSSETSLNTKIEAETTRATGVEESIEAKIGEGFGPRNTVRDEIDALSADTSASLKDIINTDHSIDINKTVPTKPVLKINIGSEGENIIKLHNDGLYANVDLSYITEANKLIFTASNGVSKEIQLDSVSSIIDMRYDPEKEAIIVTYVANGHEIKTLEIPLGSLIREWKPSERTDGAIELTLTEHPSGSTGYDILYGRVIISEHDDNILVNDNGALYVTNQGIVANTESINVLSGKVNTLETNLSTVESGLSSEVSRATEAEAELNRKINKEIEDRTADVDAEETRAKAAEANITHLIEDETERRISGDTINANAISSEVARATAAETRIENSVSDETSRARTEELAIREALASETTRAQEADAELYRSIADENTGRTAADANLQSQINQETTRAQLEESKIADDLQAEITRSTNEDERLYNAITAETTARQQGDAVLSQQIQDATLTFDETTSIDFTKTSDNIVTADVKLQGADNIIKVGQGLYATVHLSYDTGTNKIKLTTSNGEEEYQLAGATVIDNLVYDSVNKALVITYHDGNGGVHTTSFPVSELFNEWDVDQNSCVGMKLYKTTGVSGGTDKIYGEVLISNHPDNAIVLDGNHLYVSSSAMTHAEEIAECAKAELKVVENKLLGMPILTECGEGSDYIKNESATYISGATSFNNADVILDREVKKANDEIVAINEKIETISGDSECVDSKTNTIYKMLYGENSVLNPCGEGNVYQPYAGACIISAATSFNEADMLLNDAFCEMKNKWFLLGFDTPTTHTDWKEISQNRHMLVDVRLSHGNTMSMDDEDFTVSGKVSAFTETISPIDASDTNVLKIINITETNDGLALDADNPYNGLYLSNIWDCGMYYDEIEDAEAIEKAQAAGYETDRYRVDNSEAASNYDYNNNVRQ